MKRMFCFLLILMMGICPIGYGESVNLFHEDGFPHNIAGCNGSLYIVWSDELYQYLPDEGREVLITGSFDGHNYLLSAGQALYAFHTTDMVLSLLIDGAGNWVNEAIFEWEEMKEQEWVEPLLADGRLAYLQTNDDVYSENRQKIVEVDISTGEASSIAVKGVVALDRYKDDHYIALTQRRNSQGIVEYALTSIDRISGMQTELVVIDDFRTQGISYEADSDKVYLASRDSIYSWQKDEGFLCRAPILAGDIADIVAFDPDWVAAISDNSVAIRNVNPDNVAEETNLVVFEPYGRSEFYRTYVSSHPEVALSFAREDLMSNEERFIQDVLTRSDGIDIYLLSDTNLLRTIYDRGYGVDLSANDTLRASVEDMYEPFRSALLRDGNIYAFPGDVFISMLSYNPEVFERFGFQIPSTYDELFDLVLLWLDEYAQDYPDVIFDPFSNGVDLVSLLERYTDEMIRNGHDVQYNTENLKNTLQKYLEAKKRYEEQIISTYQYSSSPTNALYLVNVLGSGNHKYLLLTFDEMDQPVISGTDVEFDYYVINPASQHIDDAIEFLEYSRADREDMVNVILYQSQLTAIESSTYEREVQELQLRIGMLEQALSAADDDVEVRNEDRQALEADLTYARTNLEWLSNEGRWSVRQEEIDTYRQFAPYIYISDLNPFTIVIEDDDLLFRQLEGGSKALDSFLSELDNRIRFVYLEAE